MGNTDILDDLRATEVRLREEHRALERAIDGLHAGSARLRLGAIPKRDLEDAIYELYVMFDDHLVLEERLLAPLVPRIAPCDAARIQLMLHEHALQRTLFFSTLERTEQGALGCEALVASVARLASVLRADIAIEEELLADLARQSKISAR
jgi:hemerythrin-like domain-containing protein